MYVHIYVFFFTQSHICIECKMYIIIGFWFQMYITIKMIYLHIDICIQVYQYLCTHINYTHGVYVCMYIYICIKVNTYVQTCRYFYTCRYRRRYIHPYTICLSFIYHFMMYCRPSNCVGLEPLPCWQVCHLQHRSKYTSGMDATYLCHGPAAQMDQMGREGYALRLGSTKIGPFKTTIHHLCGWMRVDPWKPTWY